MPIDWRLLVNCIAGIFGLSFIVRGWRNGEIDALSILCAAIIAYYTLVYGTALTDSATPSAVTILLRPFTGVLLFLLGLQFYRKR
jgi:hypothetical protein